MDQRLVASRSATTGAARLDAFIEAWGNYIPEIYGIAKALLAMREADEEAAAAWDERMAAVRHGCTAAIDALEKDGNLSLNYSKTQAVVLLWTLLSVRNWEQYISNIKSLARQALVAP